MEPTLGAELNYTAGYAELTIGNYSYVVDREVMDDNIKLYHAIRNDAKGRMYAIEYTPYDKLTRDEFTDVIFQLRACEVYEELEVFNDQECEYDVA